MPASRKARSQVRARSRWPIPAASGLRAKRSRSRCAFSDRGGVPSCGGFETVTAEEEGCSLTGALLGSLALFRRGSRANRQARHHHLLDLAAHYLGHGHAKAVAGDRLALLRDVAERIEDKAGHRLLVTPGGGRGRLGARLVA